MLLNNFTVDLFKFFFVIELSSIILFSKTIRVSTSLNFDVFTSNTNLYFFLIMLFQLKFEYELDRLIIEASNEIFVTNLFDFSTI